MRVRSWTAVVISVVLLIVVGVVGLLVNRSALEAADDVHRSDTGALAVNNATLAGQVQLLAAKELAEFAGASTFRLTANNAADLRLLNAYTAKSTMFPYGALLMSPSGEVRTATTAQPLPALGTGVLTAMRTQLLGGDPAFSPVLATADSSGAGVALQAVAVPVTAGGAATGILVGFNPLARTALQAYTVKLKSDKHLTSIVDASGTVGVSSDAGTIGTKLDPALIAALQARPTEATFVEYTSGGTERIAVVVAGDQLPGTWAYVRTQDLRSFDGVVHSRSQTLSVTLLAMVIIGAVAISILGHRTQVQRRRNEERFRALFQHAPDMVAVLDAEGRIRYSSPSAATVLHLPAGSMRGRSVFDLVTPEDRPRMRETFADLMSQRDGVLRLQTRVDNGSGGTSWIEFTASNQMHNPALTGIVINSRDITENRAFQERLSHEAHHDPLTGLPNRRRLRDALGTTLSADAVAVLFVDLDGFKPVNDHHGHEAGDDLLRQVATRLSACVRAEDVLARVGGDEFVILMPGVHTPADAETMRDRVRHSLHHPFTVLGHQLTIGASVGIHLAAPTADPEEALRAADHAMYAVKHGTRPEPAHAGRHRAPE